MAVSAGRSYDDDLIRELIFTFQGIEGTMLRGRYVKQIVLDPDDDSSFILYMF